MKIAKTEWNEGFKVLRERHTTGEMHFPLLVFTLSSLAEAALRSCSLRAASASSESGLLTKKGKKLQQTGFSRGPTGVG